MDREIAAYFGGQFLLAFDRDRMSVLRYFEGLSFMNFRNQLAVGFQQIGDLLPALPATSHRIVLHMDLVPDEAPNTHIAVFQGVVQIAAQEMGFLATFFLLPMEPPRYGVGHFSWVPTQNAAQFPHLILSAVGFLPPPPPPPPAQQPWGMEMELLAHEAFLQGLLANQGMAGEENVVEEEDDENDIGEVV